MSELILEKYAVETSGKENFILSEDLRSKADQVLATTDFPTSRTEAWKYTRVAKIKNGAFKTLDLGQKTIDLKPFLIPNLKGSVLVFVNGFYASELSTIEDEKGLEISPISESTQFADTFLGQQVPLENEIFNAINTVYATDGMCVRILKDAQIKQSIQVIFINSGENTFSGIRNIISCEDFAKAHIVLNYVSENAGISTPLNVQPNFTNCISEIHVGTNANLTIDKIQQEDSSNYNIISEYVNQAKDSTFTINTITLDGGLVRNNLTIEVNGHNCETNLSGAYVLKGKQHVDNHTVVDHKVAHCQSNELYKGVIDDQATAVFNGKVFVRKDAQKINAFQSNGNVLLSDNATVNSKPELEIYADDVKCSHGSTTGQLDEEAIFYLRARGISEKGARALMVSAFIGDVIEKIENEAVQEYVYGKLEEKFGWVK
ncbi:MAG: Fe-S cluster assembly protein SufD [Flavobacteriia bacterium]|jgi:Fe-S cluster assembly protein SufD